MVNILHEKAVFLKDMVTFELEDHPLNPKLTCKQYTNMFEIQTLIFKLLLEVKEVIELFTTKNFVASNESEPLCDLIRRNRKKLVDIQEKYCKL